MESKTTSSTLNLSSDIASSLKGIFALDCQVNCPRLIMDRRTLNVACSAGFRNSCSVPERMGGYKHIMGKDELFANEHWIWRLLSKLGLVEIIYPFEPRYAYYQRVADPSLKKIGFKYRMSYKGRL